MSWFSKRNSPFAGPPKLIFHGAHHKMGTVWMMRVLEKVSQAFGLPVQKCNENSDKLDDDTRLVFANHSQLDLSSLGDFVGTHLIRDPRDAIVSGYHYHLWTEEAWAIIPREEFGGLSYQAYLNSLSLEQGLSAEISRFAKYVESYGMRQWNYEDPRVLEIKYEDLIANESDWFQLIFTHYGFHEKAIERAVKIASEFSFKRVAQRSIGESNSRNHLRSGKPRQWTEEFSREHCEEVRAKLGDLLILMGYERNSNW